MITLLLLAYLLTVYLLAYLLAYLLTVYLLAYHNLSVTYYLRVNRTPQRADFRAYPPIPSYPPTPSYPPVGRLQSLPPTPQGQSSLHTL